MNSEEAQPQPRAADAALPPTEPSQRNQDIDALRANPAQLASILEQMPVGLLLAEPGGRLIFGNQRVEQIFGAPYFRAQRIEEYGEWPPFTSDEQPYQLDQLPIVRALRGETVIGEEMRFLRADGAWIVVSAGAAPIRTAEGDIALAVLTLEDITERARREEIETRTRERIAELERTNQATQANTPEHRQAEEERKALLRQIVIAQEEERRRISHELHDQLGQQVTALLLGLQSLKDLSYGREQTLQMIEQLQGIAGEIARQVHQIALELRPTALDDLGLAAALANYVEDWGQRNQIAIDLHINNLANTRLAPEIETVIYRVCQEALTNVIKHAAARHVSLILERHGNTAVAIIEDDGHGFDVEAVLQDPEANRRLGLLGMQERVALVGGTLAIESMPDKGTTVFVRIPLPPETRVN